LLDRRDRRNRIARSYPYQPGTFTILAERENLAGYEDDMGDFAQQLKDSAWDGRSPITLIACDTGTGGRNSFAARLAMQLPGIRVYAPAGTVWVNRFGRAYVAGVAFDSQGRPRFMDPSYDNRWVSYTDVPGVNGGRLRLETRVYGRALPHPSGDVTTYSDIRDSEAFGWRPQPADR
jgi:hypothetical protein